LHGGLGLFFTNGIANLTSVPTIKVPHRFSAFSSFRKELYRVLVIQRDLRAITNNSISLAAKLGIKNEPDRRT
jgi:hypothetical protein